jgi:hypothetical protein
MIFRVIENEPDRLGETPSPLRGEGGGEGVAYQADINKTIYITKKFL